MVSAGYIVHPSRCDSTDSKIVVRVIDSFCGNRESVGMDAAFVKLNLPRVKGKKYWHRNNNNLLKRIQYFDHRHVCDSNILS